MSTKCEKGNVMVYSANGFNISDVDVNSTGKRLQTDASSTSRIVFKYVLPCIYSVSVPFCTYPFPYHGPCHPAFRPGCFHLPQKLNYDPTRFQHCDSPGNGRIGSYDQQHGLCATYRLSSRTRSVNGRLGRTRPPAYKRIAAKAEAARTDCGMI
jgi:hypothetical protein